MELARAVQRQQSAEQVGLAAAGAAFWLVIAAFPTGTAVVSLFGLVVSPEHVADDLGALARAAPASLGSLITEQLRHVADGDRAGLSVVVLLALLAGIAALYRLSMGPSVRPGQLLPGAVSAAVAVVASLAGFTAYLALSTRFAAVYGAFTGVAVGMIGLYFGVYAVLLGTVLNAQLSRTRTPPAP